MPSRTKGSKTPGAADAARSQHAVDTINENARDGTFPSWDMVSRDLPASDRADRLNRDVTYGDGTAGGRRARSVFRLLGPRFQTFWTGQVGRQIVDAGTGAGYFPIESAGADRPMTGVGINLAPDTLRQARPPHLAFIEGDVVALPPAAVQRDYPVAATTDIFGPLSSAVDPVAVLRAYSLWHGGDDIARIFTTRTHLDTYRVLAVGGSMPLLDWLAQDPAIHIQRSGNAGIEICIDGEIHLPPLDLIELDDSVPPPGRRTYAPRDGRRSLEF